MGGALSTQAEDSSHDPFPTQQDAVAPPAPADQDLHIIDDTSLLTTAELETLTAACVDVKASTGVPVVVFVSRTLGTDEESEAEWYNSIREVVDRKMAFSSESSDDTSSNASNLDSDSSDSSHTRAVKAERRAHTKANTKDYRIDRITAHHRSVWKRVSDYADQVFEAWGIGGYQGQDNGMFLFVWRHEPNWHYAIKLGSAWADNTNHFQLMDNVIEKIIKLDIPTAYNTQNSLADALQAGVSALGKLAGRVPAGELDDIVSVTVPQTQDEEGGKASLAQLPNFAGGHVHHHDLLHTYPPRPIQGSYFQFTSDLGFVMKAQDKISMEETTRAIFEFRSIPVFVVSIDKVVGFEDTAPPQRLGIYARRLFDHWGIGYQKWNRGILILMSSLEHLIAVIPGKDWDDNARRQMHAAAPPEWLGSDVGEKITNPSTALVETLTVINDLIDDMEGNAEDSDLPDPLLPFADGFCQS